MRGLGLPFVAGLQDTGEVAVDIDDDGSDELWGVYFDFKDGFEWKSVAWTLEVYALAKVTSSGKVTGEEHSGHIVERVLSVPIDFGPAILGLKVSDNPRRGLLVLKEGRRVGLIWRDGKSGKWVFDAK